MAEVIASGIISRRKALWLVGAALLSSTPLMFLFPDEAEAGNRRRRRKRRRRQAASTDPAAACDGETTLNSDEKQILDLHNQARAKDGLPPLCVHPDLTEAARAHSQEMLDKDYFSHNSYNGENVRERLERFGYTFSDYSYWTYGENIYLRFGSSSAPEDAFNWWMNSSGHRANILNKNFREIGIGVRKGAYKTYGESTMYIVDFGTRR